MKKVITGKLKTDEKQKNMYGLMSLEVIFTIISTIREMVTEGLNSLSNLI